MRTETIAVVDALCGAWSQVIDEHEIETNACILAARVGGDALRYFGIDAKPLPVQVVAQNAKLVEQLDAGKEPDWDSGAWGVGIDPDQTPKNLQGWNGHLVLWLKHDEAILDLTLGQMSRPERDIVLRSMVFGGANMEWIESATDASYDLPNGARVSYRHRPDLRGTWHHSPDWSQKKSLTGNVIRRVRSIITNT